MNILIASLIASASFGTMKEKGISLYIPFQEGKVEKDKTLEKNQAIYKFHFDVQYYDKKALKSVWMKVDNCEKVKPKLDSLGNCSYTMVPGKHNLKFYAEKCPVITAQTNVEPQTRNHFDVTFNDTTVIVVVCKPVIYLYPAKEESVHVKLNVKGELGFTWPAYGDEWTVLAYPNGKIQDEGTMYNYLFWDGKMPANKINYDKSKGSVVSKQQLAGFLEMNLTAMGMTSCEVQDFMTYWAPKMMQNEFNYVHFLVNDNYEQIAGVNVTPKPDNMLRVYMIWHSVKSQKSVNCTAQEFKNFNREGFTYVEWGGSEMPIGKEKEK